MKVKGRSKKVGNRLSFRLVKDNISRKIMIVCTSIIFLLFISFVVLLVLKSNLVISKYSIKELLFSSFWEPENHKYGFFSATFGTFIVTIFSMIMAIPISILAAVYIAEYSPNKLRRYLSSFIDVLAGIPSVVFGLCMLLGFVPIFSVLLKKWFQIETTGMCLFTASITLTVMVFPIIVSLTVESLRALPVELREISLSLGSTKWQMIKKTLFKAAGPGIISAILLGFGRALGETMAVAMVIGSKNNIPTSLFASGQTLPSLIISSFGEMMSVPEEQSALIFVALTLFVLVTVSNIIAKLVNNKLKKRWRY